MTDCGDCAEREAVMRAVCDAFALLNIPPPVVAPAVLPPTRYRLKYGVMECVQCGYAKEWCACAKQPAPEVAANDGAHSSLEKRIQDWKGK